MSEAIKISDKVYCLSVNDRKKHLFENLWPLPSGVAYNCYLIIDQKTALFDTVEIGSDLDFLARIESILGDRELDYLIVNHMEPDHSGQIKEVVRRYPNVQIVGNKKTFGILEAFIRCTPQLKEVSDGEELSLGTHNIRFVFTPWVHWPETMMSYDTTDKILFSGDAFGSFGALDGGIFDDEVCFDKYYLDEMRRYYANIVGKYSGMVQKALAKLSSVEIRVIAPLHGIVWRDNPSKVIDLYDKWSAQRSDKAVVIVYASMYGHNEITADRIARRLNERGIKDIRIYDVSKTHISYLISEIWRCKGVVLGSCAYNSFMHPNMEHLTTELQHYCVKEKLLGLFGSYSWNGGGVKNLKCFAESIDWTLVAEPIDIKGVPDEQRLAACDLLADGMARAL